MTDMHFILTVFPGIQVIQRSRNEFVAVVNGRELTKPKATETKAWYAAFLVACESECGEKKIAPCVTLAQVNALARSL